MMVGIEAIWITPTKSATGSKCRFLFTSPMMVCPFEVSISLWPSGAVLAANAVPAMPGLFSTITGWPQRSDSLSEIVRAKEVGHAAGRERHGDATL